MAVVPEAERLRVLHDVARPRVNARRSLAPRAHRHVLQVHVNPGPLLGVLDREARPQRAFFDPGFRQPGRTGRPSS